MAINHKPIQPKLADAYYKEEECCASGLPIGQEVLRDLFNICDRAEMLLENANNVLYGICREDNSIKCDEDPSALMPNYFSDIRNCNERLTKMLNRLELLLARVEL